MNAKPYLVPLCCCLLAAGCYKRQPLATTQPAPATRIVAELTDSGTAAMGNELGAGALAVEGVIASADENAWTLQMLRVDHRDGRSIDWNRELVSFPRNLLTNPNVVILDKQRSWLAGVGITVGALLMARAFNLFGASEEGEEGPPPVESVVGVGGR